MARRTGKAPQAKPQWGTEFVNWKPTAVEKSDFDEWLKGKPEAVRQVVDDMALTGHRISITFSVDMDAFTCALTPRDEQDINFGFTLSLKSGDWLKGVYALAYYSQIAYKGSKWVGGLHDDVF